MNLTVHEVAVAVWTRLDSLTVGIVITFELSFDLDPAVAGQCPTSINYFSASPRVQGDDPLAVQ